MMNMILKFLPVLIEASNTNIEEPRKLYDLCTKAIAKSIQDEDAHKIFERMYCGIFKDSPTADNSAMLAKNHAPIKICDLSNLDLERIPMTLSKEMDEVEILDLSGNKNLNLRKVFSEIPFPNLKSVILDNCILEQEDLEALALHKGIESLSISNSFGFNIASP